MSVKWYEQDVLLRVENASAEFLLALGFQVEAEAKVRAPVDTGFLRNSSYVNGAGQNTFVPRHETLTSKKTGQTAEHETVGSAQSAEDGVAVGFGADYAVYVEAEQPFLYPALQSVAQQANGIIEAVGRKHFD
jgi:hypothetical protein